MLGTIQSAEKYLYLKIIQLVEVVVVIALVKRPKDSIRQPVQKSLDGRVRKLAIGVADAGEPRTTFTVHQGLPIRPLHQLNNAARRLPGSERPHQTPDE